MRHECHEYCRARDLCRLRPFARDISAMWNRLSLRAKLLLVSVLVDVIAGCVIGGVTVMRARTSTRVEIAASMALAETLVAEAIGQSNQQAVRSLFEHAPHQRLMRHVRLSVRNAAEHLPATIGSQQGGTDAVRSSAPAWFEALIAPPVERRELPIVADGQTVGSVLITGVADDEIAEAWESFVALAAVGAGVNIAAIMLLYVLFGRVLEPLTNLGTGLRDLEGANTVSVSPGRMRGSSVQLRTVSIRWRRHWTRCAPRTASFTAGSSPRRTTSADSPRSNFTMKSGRACSGSRPMLPRSPSERIRKRSRSGHARC